MRKFLVVLDDTPECQNAMRYAAMRAARTAGGVVVLATISAEEIQHGIGVADLMRAEAEERITSQYNIFAKWMRDKQSVEPELIIREGDPAQQLVTHIAEDPQIGVIVLGASSGKGGPGPLVTRLTRDIGTLPCPLTLVPGDISKDRLEEIT
ncbi:MAG: universal stress protein [Paracoccus sp. (in: a-proteobacteria)]|nr:universal stress protein [Paracoccus sp. (in: a-proteobacteria)]